MIRVLDARKDQLEHAKKHSGMVDFISLEVRNGFLGRQVTLSMIKYAYKFSCCRNRNVMISKRIVED